MCQLASTLYAGLVLLGDRNPATRSQEGAVVSRTVIVSRARQLPKLFLNHDRTEENKAQVYSLESAVMSNDRYVPRHQLAAYLRDFQPLKFWQNREGRPHALDALAELKNVCFFHVTKQETGLG